MKLITVITRLLISSLIFFLQTQLVFSNETEDDVSSHAESAEKRSAPLLLDENEWQPGNSFEGVRIPGLFMHHDSKFLFHTMQLNFPEGSAKSVLINIAVSIDKHCKSAIESSRNAVLISPVLHDIFFNAKTSNLVIVTGGSVECEPPSSDHESEENDDVQDNHQEKANTEL